MRKIPCFVGGEKPRIFFKSFFVCVLRILSLVLVETEVKTIKTVNSLAAVF